MKSKEKSELVVTALENIKGQSITCINVENLTQITDYMVIVTGTSNTHVKAMADEVIVALKEAGNEVTGVEGREQAEWVLVDAGDVIVHLMLAPVRALYKLEDLWNFHPGKEEPDQAAKTD